MFYVTHNDLNNYSAYGFITGISTSILIYDFRFLIDFLSLAIGSWLMAKRQNCITIFRATDY